MKIENFGNTQCTLYKKNFLAHMVDMGSCPQNSSSILTVVSEKLEFVDDGQTDDGWEMDGHLCSADKVKLKMTMTKC